MRKRSTRRRQGRRKTFSFSLYSVRRLWCLTLIRILMLSAVRYVSTYIGWPSHFPMESITDALWCQSKRVRWCIALYALFGNMNQWILSEIVRFTTRCHGTAATTDNTRPTDSSYFLSCHVCYSIGLIWVLSCVVCVTNNLQHLNRRMYRSWFLVHSWTDIYENSIAIVGLGTQ